jgi:hypothetical protein
VPYVAGFRTVGNFPTDGIEWNSDTGGQLLLTSIMFPFVPAASVASDVNNDPAVVGLPAAVVTLSLKSKEYT